MNISNYFPVNQIYNFYKNNIKIDFFSYFKSNRHISDFNHKFESSCPTLVAKIREEKLDYVKKFHNELDRFEAFLKLQITNIESVPDLVYISVGHGESHDQIWPGFVFEALNQNKDVLTILLEKAPFKFPYDQNEKAFDLMSNLHKDLFEKENDLFNKLSHYQLEQFLCGLPEFDSKCEEGMTEEIFKIYLIVSNMLYYKTNKQKIRVIELYGLYIETLLNSRRTVILGDHRGAIYPENNLLVELYNSLVDHYPNQLKFVWGWHGVNALTSEKITWEDVDPEKLTDKWTIYTNLKDCIFDN